MSSAGHQYSPIIVGNASGDAELIAKRSFRRGGRSPSRKKKNEIPTWCPQRPSDRNRIREIPAGLDMPAATLVRAAARERVLARHNVDVEAAKLAALFRESFKGRCSRERHSAI
jgi:hypothetical protein